MNTISTQDINEALTFGHAKLAEGCTAYLLARLCEGKLNSADFDMANQNPEKICNVPFGLLGEKLQKAIPTLLSDELLRLIVFFENCRYNIQLELSLPEFNAINEQLLCNETTLNFVKLLPKASASLARLKALVNREAHLTSLLTPELIAIMVKEFTAFVQLLLHENGTILSTNDFPWKRLFKQIDRNSRLNLLRTIMKTNAINAFMDKAEHKELYEAWLTEEFANSEPDYKTLKEISVSLYAIKNDVIANAGLKEIEVPFICQYIQKLAANIPETSAKQITDALDYLEFSLKRISAGFKAEGCIKYAPNLFSALYKFACAKIAQQTIIAFAKKQYEEECQFWYSLDQDPQTQSFENEECLSYYILTHYTKPLLDIKNITVDRLSNTVVYILNIWLQLYPEDWKQLSYDVQKDFLRQMENKPLDYLAEHLTEFRSRQKREKELLSKFAVS